MANFLESNDETLFKNLLINTGGDEDMLGQLGIPPEQIPIPAHKVAAPKPGFCVKLKNDKTGEKVFINVCQADNLPEPKYISDDDLIKLLQTDEAPNFRVPLSLGQPHAELDKNDQGCTAYDVIIHPNFLIRVQNSDVMLGFLLTIAMEGLEAKYDITLDRKWKILKNRKFVGSLPEQNIRSHPTPLIQDMNNESPFLGNSGNSLISEVMDDTSNRTKEPPVPKAPQPPYTIIQEPPEGQPQFLVAEMHLPKVKAASSLTIDVGEDRIVLHTRSNIYYLDIYLPYNIIQEECAAQYNKNTNILTLTMPVSCS